MSGWWGRWTSFYLTHHTLWPQNLRYGSQLAWMSVILMVDVHSTILQWNLNVLTFMLEMFLYLWYHIRENIHIQSCWKIKKDNSYHLAFSFVWLLQVGSKGIEAAWAGGERGRQVIDRFLTKVSDLLSEEGLFYMVVIKENIPGNF